MVLLSRIRIALLLVLAIVLVGGIAPSESEAKAKRRAVKSNSASSSRSFKPITRKDREKWESYADEVLDLISSGDGLSARVAIQKLAKISPDRKTWLRVREVLHRSQWLGWDILRLWERFQPSDFNRPRFTGIDRAIAGSSQFLLQRKFGAAFSGFQRVAKFLRREIDQGNTYNNELYYTVLHLMGQSLYGDGRFEDALTVYGWIPPVYYKYKQVLFEKMWAAFRAGRIDEANGALAAQYSSYFKFLEPESYLVQVYVYRKMCRDKDFSLVLKHVKNFSDKLKSGEYNFVRWLQSDLHRSSYQTVIFSKKVSSSSLVSKADRQAEKERLLSALMRKYESDKSRLEKEIGRVYAFASLALSASANELPKVRKLPSQEELLNSGLEMWPVDDGEDWLDELGNQVFIGESQCKSPSPQK